VPTQVIVLNDASSSGMSGIARCLQAVLPEPWLSLGVDTFNQGMPLSPGVVCDLEVDTTRTEAMECARDRRPRPVSAGPRVTPTPPGHAGSPGHR
jgi:chloramphenicol 3-O-phosphotransferase